jgi:glycosyltransferase involved in cell wall biosynthesis
MARPEIVGMSFPLVYALHSGELYGTERMALSTASGLVGDFSPIFMAPPGPALEEARRTGFTAIAFQGARQFASAIRPIIARSTKLAFFATGVMHSSVCHAWNMWYRRRIAHLHVVHGGAAEKLSYGRKGKLNGRPIKFIAVSSYVRERLIANGVRSDQIDVIENFLPSNRVSECPRRPSFARSGVRRLIVISRLDPEKRVDLLLSALSRDSDSRRFEVRIFGAGWNGEELRKRASDLNLNVVFEGFQRNVGECLAESDLLVHLCPVEPFGLAIIESMAAGVPVLVPDAGGAGSLVDDNVTGFRFHANDPLSLNERLHEISSLPVERLNSVANNARRLLETRFCESARIADYRRILMEQLA